MLYEMTDDGTGITPIPFECFRKEKHLENMLAQHLFDTVFQGDPLLPFHQETQGEHGADIYAVNRYGDVVIFELKRGLAAQGALDQLLRYAERAGQWKYSEIERRFKAYTPDAEDSSNLAKAHKEAFDLPMELREDEFNLRQFMWVVGCAADDALLSSVEFWKSKGLPIDFFPYRVYRIGGRMYFEFFSKPYDRHLNPADAKGVIFDTNWSYDKTGQCLKDMFNKQRVSAYGDRRDAVNCLNKGDFVFYSHRRIGVVGAARVISGVKEEAHQKFTRERYFDVELLTPAPRSYDLDPPAMKFGEVSSFLEHGFFWARIDKYPYLTVKESDRLVKELKRILVDRTVE